MRELKQVIAGNKPDWIREDKLMGMLQFLADNTEQCESLKEIGPEEISLLPPEEHV